MIQWLRMLAEERKKLMKDVEDARDTSRGPSSVTSEDEAEPRDMSRDERGVTRLSLLVDVVVAIVGVVLFVYFLLDDTPEDWLIRLGFAGAITAGLWAVLHALASLGSGDGR